MKLLFTWKLSYKIIMSKMVPLSQKSADNKSYKVMAQANFFMWPLGVTIT
jgi:hypothetical protein